MSRLIGGPPPVNGRIRQVSDVDVALPVGCADDEYLAALDNWLPLLFTSARPDLTFFQAGCGPNPLYHRDDLVDRPRAMGG